MNSILIDTLKGKKTSRPPVWFMRQAGRVLPDYNKLRETYSFTELMEDAKLATQITLMPVSELGVDAAILFSDILVIPASMGMKFNFSGKGPKSSVTLKEIGNPVNFLKPDESKLEYIYHIIDRINKKKSHDIPLIGFCGGPLTTLCYMIEGFGSAKDFPETVNFFYQREKEAKKLIDLVTEVSIIYARGQIAHGIDVFQLFETHAGIIPADLYKEMILPSVKKIGDAVRETGTPFIYFPKGIGTGLNFITKDIADFVSIDWQTPLSVAKKILPAEVGIQGNLDPRILMMTNEKDIIHELEKYSSFFREKRNWIFNLGHGFIPDTPVKNIHTTVRWVKNKNWIELIEQ